MAGIVITVLLTILKIILILLLVILALVILVLVLPIRYETEGIPPAAGGEMLWRCTADVCDIRARPAGDRIAVDMDLSLSMTVLSREKIRCVREIALESDPVAGAEEGRLRICYPEPGETIWEVGKRYRACQKSLCEKNGLPDAHAKCGGEPILV